MYIKRISNRYCSGYSQFDFSFFAAFNGLVTWGEPRPDYVMEPRRVEEWVKQKDAYQEETHSQAEHNLHLFYLI